MEYQDTNFLNCCIGNTMTTICVKNWDVKLDSESNLGLNFLNEVSDLQGNGLHKNWIVHIVLSQL